MNNEETQIILPKNEAKKSAETPKIEDPKETKKDNTTAKVAATAAAGVFGGATGGAASVAATTILNADEQEEVVEEVQAEEPVAAVKPQPVAEVKEEEIAITPEKTQEPDYTGNEGADPVVEPQPEPTPASNEEPEQEVQILGVYERTTEEGVHQEMAVITNGEEVAAVLDVTGNGEADIIAIDENRNGEFEEGEVHDISEQHVGMEQFEQQYLAQQEMEAEQQETFSYTAQEESDYNNDAELIDA